MGAKGSTSPQPSYLGITGEPNRMVFQGWGVVDRIGGALVRCYADQESSPSSFGKIE